MQDWVVEVVRGMGPLGVGLLMFLENVFPPLPSEVIMPLAGYLAARGEADFWPMVIAGTAGSLLGALFWYGIGRWLGAERLKRWAGRHGRWLTLAPEEVDQATGWFRRHCGLAVLTGRMIPAIRSLISVPAGIAGMPLARFLAYSALGTAAWTALLAGAGYLLEDQYRQVQGWLNPVSNVIFAGMAAWYVYRVVTFRPRPAH